MPAKIDALSKGFKGLAVETDPIGTFTALMQILSIAIDIRSVWVDRVPRS